MARKQARASPQLKRKIAEQLEAERVTKANVVVLADYRRKGKP